MARTGMAGVTGASLDIVKEQVRRSIAHLDRARITAGQGQFDAADSALSDAQSVLSGLADWLSLNFQPPLARSTDPETSHQAAAEHIASGKVKEQQIKLLTWMQQHIKFEDWDALTGREISDRSGLDYDWAHKRLSDLLAQGQIKRTIVRKCAVTGKQAATWRALRADEIAPVQRPLKLRKIAEQA